MTHPISRVDDPVVELLPDTVVALDDSDLLGRPTPSARDREEYTLCLQFSPDLDEGQSGRVFGKAISGTNVLPMVYQLLQDLEAGRAGPEE